MNHEPTNMELYGKMCGMEAKVDALLDAIDADRDRTTQRLNSHSTDIKKVQGRVNWLSGGLAAISAIFGALIALYKQGGQ
jgi:hypothetical protein